MVLEADGVVGGISRTVERDGWRFDIGGHRFFTKVQPVEDLWHEILPDEDFMLRPRKSRIYYQGKFYDYPLQGLATPCGNLGPDRGGPLRAVLRCGPGSTRRSDQDHLRGLAGGPLRVAPLPPLLQDLHREGLGASRLGDARGLGRATGQEPVAGQRHRQRPAAQAQPERHHFADRGVPVPQVGAGDDVGALPRRWSRRPAPRW